MSVKFKVLASGSLAASCPVNVLYPLYPVPLGKAAVAVAMRFVNTHTASIPFTVVLRHPPSNGEFMGDIPVFPPDLPLGSGLLLVEENELPLTAGDAIWAKVGTDADHSDSYAGKIDFVISGIERAL